ncbi:MAG: hypothetical protein LBH07_02010, partial [Treponema sp.]|nr:hypothetical protein [Treponema sp.]
MEKLRFVDDISIKNVHTGIFLRSPVVSGILNEIKTPLLPHNINLVTAAAIPGLRFLQIDGV